MGPWPTKRSNGTSAADVDQKLERIHLAALALALPAVAGSGLAAQTEAAARADAAVRTDVPTAPAAPDDVTFSRDIAPILQRACVRCHRDNGVGPMSLVHFDEVEPYASQIVRRTRIRDRMGAMPPWYVEKDIGIQHFKDDMSLDDREIDALEQWWRAGTPEGDPADLPPPLEFDDDVVWVAGEPDLISSSRYGARRKARCPARGATSSRFPHGPHPKTASQSVEIRRVTRRPAATRRADTRDATPSAAASSSTT